MFRGILQSVSAGGFKEDRSIRATGLLSLRDPVSKALVPSQKPAPISREVQVKDPSSFAAGDTAGLQICAAGRLSSDRMCCSDRDLALPSIGVDRVMPLPARRQIRACQQRLDRRLHGESDHDNGIDTGGVDGRASSLPYYLLQRHGSSGAFTRCPRECLGDEQEVTRSVPRE